MRNRSVRSGTELAREIKLTDWSMAGNLSNRSSGVQIPRDICTRLKRYLWSGKCSWIINTSTSADRRQTSWYLQHDPGVELGSTKKQLKEINTSTSVGRRQTSWLYTT